MTQGAYKPSRVQGRTAQAPTSQPGGRSQPQARNLRVLPSLHMNLHNLLTKKKEKIFLDGWMNRNCFLCELSSSKNLPLISLVLILQSPAISALDGLMRQVSTILKVINKREGNAPCQVDFEPNSLTTFQKLLFIPCQVCLR